MYTVDMARMTAGLSPCSKPILFPGIKNKYSSPAMNQLMVIALGNDQWSMYFKCKYHAVTMKQQETPRRMIADVRASAVGEWWSPWLQCGIHERWVEDAISRARSGTTNDSIADRRGRGERAWAAPDAPTTRREGGERRGNL